MQNKTRKEYKDMKKIIALIISVILVIAIFASCAPATEDAAITSAEIETDATNIEATIDMNLGNESEKVITPGFYLKDEMYYPLVVGSEVPQNSILGHFTQLDKQTDRFYVHDGNQFLRITVWYGSGDTAYTVKKIGKINGAPGIWLTPMS